MEITDVRIFIPPPSQFDTILRAYVSITLDNCFVVRHIRIVKTDREKGFLVSMPSRKLPNGDHKDLAHPITKEFRKKIEDVILNAYKTHVESIVANKGEAA